MTAAYDPHWDWEQDRKDREEAARLLTRIPDYNDPDPDCDPFADIDEWKEAS